MLSISNICIFDVDSSLFDTQYNPRCLELYFCWICKHLRNILTLMVQLLICYKPYAVQRDPLGYRPQLGLETSFLLSSSFDLILASIWMLKTQTGSPSKIFDNWKILYVIIHVDHYCTQLCTLFVYLMEEVHLYGLCLLFLVVKLPMSDKYYLKWVVCLI